MRTYLECFTCDGCNKVEMYELAKIGVGANTNSMPPGWFVLQSKELEVMCCGEPDCVEDLGGRFKQFIPPKS